MNIIYDHQIFVTQRYGGISRYVCEIARNIARTPDNNAKVFAPLHINKYLGTSLRERRYQVEHFRRESVRKVIASFDQAMGSFFINHRNGVQIFHETYYSKNTYAPPGAKRIVTIYDMIHERFPKLFRQDDITSNLKKRAVERADHIICISQSTRLDLMRIFGTPSNKITVTYLGHSLTSPIQVNDIEISNRPFLLFVGYRTGYKNFERFLRAYSYSDVLKREFLVVCFGGGRFSRQEISMIESLHIPSGMVTWLEGDDSVLSYLYSNAAALVYPSLYEGFGIPPLEAMAYNCPVACSRASSLPEVVGDAAELFDPTQEDAIRVAIEQIVTSPSRSDELKKLGIRQSKLFSWQKCAQDTISAYKIALAK